MKSKILTYTISGQKMSEEKVKTIENNFGIIFKVIALFSVINSALLFFRIDMLFPTGLAISAILDTFLLGLKDSEISTAHMKIVSTVILGVNLLIAASFYAFYKFSSMYKLTWYRVGALFFLIDAGICIWAEEYIFVAFHVFFLFVLLSGYTMAPKIIKAKVYFNSQKDLDSTSEKVAV